MNEVSRTISIPSGRYILGGYVEAVIETNRTTSTLTVGKLVATILSAQEIDGGWTITFAHKNIKRPLTETVTAQTEKGR